MKFIRIALERLSRGIILKRHILVNGGKIPILVSPDAQLKYLKPGLHAFDTDLIRIAEIWLKQTSNIWDLGANVGVFTIAASAVAKSGTVLAVEPDIWLASIIQRTAQLKGNKEKDIRVMPVAVSENNAVTVLHIAKRGRASNSLEIDCARSQMGGIREKQYVPTVTLDSLLEAFPRPDFIKMDVEGAELKAVKGGFNVISRLRPVFYIEVGEQVSKEIQQIFFKQGYRMFDGETYQSIKSCVFNTFFVPEEKCGAYNFLKS